MEIKRRLRKVGGSVMLAIPPEILDEAGLSEGANVVVRSQPGGGFQVEPAGLSPEFLSWVHRNLERFDGVYRQLADR